MVASSIDVFRVAISQEYKITKLSSIHFKTKALQVINTIIKYAIQSVKQSSLATIHTHEQAPLLVTTCKINFVGSILSISIKLLHMYWFSVYRLPKLRSNLLILVGIA